jgi:tetratricopeptide (TPR) repeat protein
MKEQTDQEILNDHNFIFRNKIIITVFLAVFVIIAILIFYFCNKSHVAEIQTKELPPAINEVENSKTENSQEDLSKEQKSAQNFYNDGLAKMEDKKWSEAVDEMSQAINMDNNNSEYYLKKSEAEYMLGDKEAAINTLNSGLGVDPENQLMKDKLEILTRDSFNEVEGEVR